MEFGDILTAINTLLVLSVSALTMRHSHAMLGSQTVYPLDAVQSLNGMN